jgi:hypothetical protein
MCIRWREKEKKKRKNESKLEERSKAQPTISLITLHPYRSDLLNLELDFMALHFFTPTSAASSSFGPSLPPPHRGYLRWCPRHMTSRVGSRLIHTDFCCHRSATTTTSFYSCHDQVNRREVCSFQKRQRR